MENVVYAYAMNTRPFLPLPLPQLAEGLGTFMNNEPVMSVYKYACSSAIGWATLLTWD